MPAWIDLIVGGYEVGKELGLWKKLLTRFRKSRRVLVLGASGAGKTQFVESLTNPTAPPRTRTQRTVSVQKRKLIVEDDPFVLVDTPGQMLDEAKRKRAIDEVIRGRFEGIINVVCYGYHEADEAAGLNPVPERGSAVAKPAYLRSRRQVEVDLLSEWVPRVDASSVDWVLTVVTKADLWWPDESGTIKKHYEAGEYAGQLDHLRKMHAVVPYCAIIEPFYGGRTGGRFGESEKSALRHHLIESVLRLTGA
jgi:hypothetical protein